MQMALCNKYSPVCAALLALSEKEVYTYKYFEH